MDSPKETNHVLELLSNVLGRGGRSHAAYAASARLMDYFGSAQCLSQATLEEIRNAGRISARQASSLYYALERVLSARLHTQIFPPEPAQVSAPSAIS